MEPANHGMAVELKQRTKVFALRIVRLFKALPKTDEGRVLGRQVLRSGTAVGANYRAVCRARSRKEFIAKCGIVVEECDETLFRLELLVEAQVMSAGATCRRSDRAVGDLRSVLSHGSGAETLE